MPGSLLAVQVARGAMSGSFLAAPGWMSVALGAWSVLRALPVLPAKQVQGSAEQAASSQRAQALPWALLGAVSEPSSPVAPPSTAQTLPGSRPRPDQSPSFWQEMEHYQHRASTQASRRGPFQGDGSADVREWEGSNHSSTLNTHPPSSTLRKSTKLIRVPTPTAA